MSRETDNDIASQLAAENPFWIFKIKFAPTVAEMQEESRLENLDLERRTCEEADKLIAQEDYLFEE